jgi:SAM-dependent methyltransferase
MEYITDVPYARAFHDQFSPSMLRLVAALNGFSPSPQARDDLDFCELGCGAGDTIVTLAAAWPNARFVGVDFNEEHIAFARALAKRGSIDNVRFLERDFEDLARENLPAFDFVAMHGVASWIAPAKWITTLGWVAERLKPGAFFYVSYNALPGWAALEPMRRAMLDATSSTPGSTLDRARAAMQFLQRLFDAKSPYFAHHPTAQSMLGVMQKAGASYVAHEYFLEHWRPRRFADVARETKEHDLHFVGEIPLHFAFRALSLPSALKEMAASIDDRIAYESFKDFALDEMFRCDVYVKGDAASEGNARAWLESTPFGTLAPAPLVRREVKLPHYTMQLVGPLYDALLDAIASGAKSARDLSRLPAFASFEVNRIVDALKSLSLGGQVVPMRADVGSASANGALRLALPAHDGVIEEALASRVPIALASRVAGTGLRFSMLDAVSVRLLVDVPTAERAAWIRSFVDRTPLKLFSGDRAITDKGELATIVEREVARFASQWPDKLVELGVLARA